MPASDVEIDGEDVSHDDSIYFDLGDASDDEEADVLWRLLQQARRRQQNPSHSRQNSLDDGSSGPSSSVATGGGGIRNVYGDFLDDDGAVSGLDMELDFGDPDHDHDYDEVEVEAEESESENGPHDDPEDADLGSGDDDHDDDAADDVHRRHTRTRTGARVRSSSNFDPALDRLDPAEILRQLLPQDGRGGIFGLPGGPGGVRSTLATAREDDFHDESDENSDNSDTSDHHNANHSGPIGGRRDFADVIQRLMGGGIVFGGAGPFGGESSEIDSLVGNLEQREDLYLVLELLNQLSEKLLMMNGITAERVIPAVRLARALVAILEDQKLADELELCLVACRCLYNFLEVNQDFVHEAMSAGAVAVLCSKLMDVQYIDLTEQVLQTLEMILRDRTSHAQIVRHGGLLACLQYLDFFTVHAQRRALLIVSNACLGVTIDHSLQIIEVFDVLALTAEHHGDSMVVEHAWMALLRVILAFRSDRDFLENLFCKESLLHEILRVIYQSLRQSKGSGRSVASSNDHVKGSTGGVGADSDLVSKDMNFDITGAPLPEMAAILASFASDKQSISYSLCLSLIRLLIVLISASTKVSSLLLDQRIGAVVVQALLQYSRKDLSLISALMAAPKELLIQFLTLIGHVLPISYPLSEAPFLRAGFVSNATKGEADGCRAELCRTSNSYTLFVNDIWGLLLSAYQATMDFEVRRRVFIGLHRIVAFAGSSETLQSTFAQINSLESIATVLDSAISQGKASIERGLDSREVLQTALLSYSSLLMIKTLISKAGPSILSSLEKEGVVKNLEDLSSVVVETELKEPIEKGDDIVTSSGLSPSRVVSYADPEFGRDYEITLSKTHLENRILQVLLETKSAYEEHGHPSVAGSVLLMAEELSDILRQLQKTNISFTNEKFSVQLKRLVQCLSADTSAFELISSGIIDILADLLEDMNSDSFDIFVSVFQGDFLVLLRHMQDCLTKSENFDIVSSGVFNSSRLPDSKAASLARQTKIRISCLDDDRENLENVVLSVQAIATFRTIEAFLNGRLWIMGASGNSSNEKASEIEAQERSQDGIEFLIDGEVVPSGTTIYGAIYRLLQLKNGGIVDTQKIWLGTHEVAYRHVPAAKNVSKSPEPMVPFHQVEDDESMPQDKVWTQTLAILRVIKGLYDANLRMRREKRYPGIQDSHFTNWKLTVKLNRQLEEPLVVASGTLPSWSVYLPQHFPMVFALDTRLFFLQLTSFGYSRLINHWQQRTNQENEGNQNGNSSLPQLGRPVRQKVRLSRKQMLQSAVKMLEMYGLTPGILEIEYFDEVGSGLGPTLEFYLSVSKDFSRKRLHLWRSTENDSDELDYVRGLLFPAPIAHLLAESSSKVLFFFSVLGKFIARAMLDLRIIDFNFNPVFLRLVLGLNGKNISLEQVDKQLSSSVEHLKKYLVAFKQVYGAQKRNKLVVDGCSLDDLALTFELPGYSNYDLGPQTGEPVDESNLAEFVDLVTRATLDVSQQVAAFREGFSKVFPISSIGIFLPEELAAMFGLAKEDWLLSTLAAAVKADHGYTKELDAIQLLLRIMEKFLDGERRAFLQFLTGAPKLPVGGFKALRPELTVVKKPAEDGLTSDDYLPSVMTCANYLKLPAYLLEEVMQRKLQQAMYEGAGAFLLS